MYTSGAGKPTARTWWCRKWFCFEMLVLLFGGAVKITKVEDQSVVGWL
jgi:hypothetical protein